MHRWSTWSRGTILTRLPVVAFALLLLAGSGGVAQDAQTVQLEPVITSAVKHDT
jgi:hypothetical protein